MTVTNHLLSEHKDDLHRSGLSDETALVHE